MVEHRSPKPGVDWVRVPLPLPIIKQHKKISKVNLQISTNCLQNIREFHFLVMFSLTISLMLLIKHKTCSHSSQRTSRTCLGSLQTVRESSAFRSNEKALRYGDIAQLVERLLCKQDVAGSNPTISTNGESIQVSPPTARTMLYGAAMAVAIRWPSIKGHRPTVGHPALTRITVVRIQLPLPFFRQVPALHMSGQASSKGPNR